jgi:predicted transcriptional regulator
VVGCRLLARLSGGFLFLRALLELLVNLGLYVHDNASAVYAAVLAHAMRQARFPAGAACRNSRRHKFEMRAPVVAVGLG